MAAYLPESRGSRDQILSPGGTGWWQLNSSLIFVTLCCTSLPILGLCQRNLLIPESAFEGGDEGGDAVHPEDVAGGEGGVGGGGEEGLLALDGDEEG